VYLSWVRSKKRSFGTRVCFDETEANEETSVRMLKASDFYELKKSLLSNHPKRRAFY
jgi:hypothetical protein